MAEIVLKNVTKIYKGNSNPSVSDLNLSIKDGEFVVLVGPSGCGKSTALRMVAGLEEITDGTITIDGKVVNDTDPGDRDIAMVFQNYALYPHMTVFDNIAFPLKSRNVPKNEIEAKVTTVANLLGLGEYLKRKPKTLSGGQRQRVAMGRALVRAPQAFLMDEPLSNLDAKLRVQMRTEICQLQKEMGITTIYVTHDQVEAMTMGSRIAVMRFGVLQQYATPQEIFDSPANIFVASFIGSPSMNFISVKVGNDNNGVFIDYRGNKYYIDEDSLNKHQPLIDYVGKEIAFGIRPEHLLISECIENSITANVYHVELLGAEKLVYATIDADSLSVDQVLAGLKGDIQKSDDLLLKNDSAKIVIKIDSQLMVKEGDRIQLNARDGLMHFFDLDGGKAII